jgi:hypothetical protein
MRGRGLLGVGLAGAVLALSPAGGGTADAATTGYSSVTPCPAAAPGHATCLTRVLTHAGRPVHPTLRGAVTPFAGPSGGLDPTQVRDAYSLPSAPPSGATPTIAIVDAFHYGAITGSGVTDAASTVDDLAVYRSQFGLGACTAAGGCFRKVDQWGGSAYPTTTAESAGWAIEGDLDVDAVSAVCPACHILFVEARSDGLDDLMTGVSTAVALGASEVSLSFGGDEYAAQTAYDAALNHAGVAITAATGDNGFGTSYPASSPYVTAVGGTTLTPGAGGGRGWTETAWSGGGSGCSTIEPKPSWQHDPLCSGRTEADVAAVADPQTGLDVFSAGAWQVIGGTSLSAPVVAGMYALGGGEGAAVGALPFYRAPSVHDILGGTNSTLPCLPAALCAAGAGFDGPTGLGSPDGPPVPVPASQASASPASLSFAPQPVGSRSAAQTATLTNSGSTDVHVSTVSLGGPDPADFALTGDRCSGATVPSGASCSVGVVFAPGSPGTRTASLALADDATASPQSVALSGTAVGAPLVSLPATVAFGGRGVGSTGPDQTVTLQNSGTATLNVGGVSVSGTPFTLGGNGCAGAALAPGASCSLSVGFSPAARTAFAGTLTIADDAPNSPQTVSLTGTGTASTASYIQSAYTAMLGHDADSGALASWVSRLDAGTSRGALAIALATSAEYRGDVIGGAGAAQGFYQQYLGRASDPGGVAYWIGRMAGGSTFEQVRLAFIGSPEYFAHHHNNPGEAVDALYNDVLGRAPDPGGRAYWVSHFDATTIAGRILYSAEARSRLVGGYYQAILGRSADGGGLAYWTQAILGGASDEQILAFLLSSDEFYASH